MEITRLLRNAAIHADREGAEIGVPTSISIMPFGIQVRCSPMPGRFSSIGAIQRTVDWSNFHWFGGEGNPISDVIDQLHLRYKDARKVA